ncbi:MAG: DegT/DnrJ/EryC1/StrS family aminotransferase [Candidatus Methanomethylophilaceae archaeon]|nr:DegT/DnrJ/EryC1/StrS family aminotransferase [Candidatus Methanomethylophilaceae archaeon]
MVSADRRITVTKPSLPPMEEYVKEIEGIWANKWLTNMGPKHLELEEKLKEYLDVENISLFVNGHAALENAIAAFDFERGSEVITTPFTFPSTTHAIVRNNLVPVFCDIKKDDYTIDESKIEPLITDKTCAIIPVHVYGNICNVEEIERIAKKHNLKVIYDSAHAFGERYKGVGVGQFGDASMFSFHATKVFNTIEGGCITTKDAGLIKRLSMLKNFGIEGPETIDYIGGNAKMNEFSAAMGICNLRHVEDNIRERKAITERYIERLGHIKGIHFNKTRDDQTYNYAYMPVLFDPAESGTTRDRVFERLQEENIGSRKYFYPLVSDYGCYKNDYDSKDTPVAKYVSDNILTIPIYPGLSIADVDDICDVIEEEIKHANR